MQFDDYLDGALTHAETCGIPIQVCRTNKLRTYLIQHVTRAASNT